MELTNNSKRNDLLKLIALITMFIDHIGHMFLPELLFLRTIGRIAFPIFAYQLSVGYEKTSDLKRYIYRLFIFGLITQIPYSFFNEDLEFIPYRLNIMFTLAVSLIFIFIFNKFKENLKNNTLKSTLYIIILISILGINEFFAITYEHGGLEYGFYGILLVFIFYLFKDNFLKLSISFISLSFIHAFYYGVYYTYMYNPDLNYTYIISNWFYILKHVITFNDSLLTLKSYFFQARSIFALIIIFSLKNIKTTFILNKWIGYLFYPSHILIFILIRYFFF